MPDSSPPGRDNHLGGVASGLLFDHRHMVRDYIVLAILTGILTALAARYYPVWADDARVEMMAMNGTDIAEQHIDRPVMGWIFQTIHTAKLAVPAGMLIHFSAHFALAALTWTLWRRVFFRYPEWSLSAACLTLAPAISEVQFVLLNIPVPVVTPSALALGAALLVQGSQRNGARVVPRQLAGCVLIATGVIISEYALPALAANVAALLVIDLSNPIVRKQRLLRSLLRYVPIFASGLIAYGMYQFIADAAFREAVRPERLFAEGLGWRLRVTPPRLLSMFWNVTAGRFLGALGRINALTPGALAATGFAVAGAVLMVVLCRKPKRPYEHIEPSEAAPSAVTSALALAGGVFVGLIPIVLMGGIVTHQASSRFFEPVLPVAVCLTHAMVYLLLQPGFRWIMPAIVGLHFGWGVSSQAIGTEQDLRMLRNLAPQLRERLAPEALTVAVIDAPFDWNAGHLVCLQNEMMVHATRDWTKEERDRFWIFTKGDYKPNILPGLHTEHASMNRVFRTVGRKGPISKVIWITFDGDRLPVITESNKTIDGD